MSNNVIWFDFENAPHVWVLKDIIGHFKEKGFDVINTARDFSSTLELCEFLGVEYVKIGERENSKYKYSKLLSVIKRGYALKHYLNKRAIKPVIAISHGSRSQAFAAYLMGVKAITIDDYEHSFKGFNKFVENILTPFPIKPIDWGKYKNKVINYPGLKENLYLWNKNNYMGEDSKFIDENKINIIFRPESPYTHYASEKSKLMQNKVISLLSKQNNLNIILFARSQSQEKELRNHFHNSGVSVMIPKGALNGPSLIYKSDAVFSGGGTMSREACVLNTPSYNFFGGEIGRVDKFLVQEKKMIYLNSASDVSSIILSKKKPVLNYQITKDAFNFVNDFIRDKIYDIRNN